MASGFPIDGEVQMSTVLADTEQSTLQSTLESLRQSEALKARLLETSRDCVKILDLDARLLYMNEGGMAVLEICDLGPVIGSSWIEFWNGEDKEAAANAVAQARRGEVGRFVGYFPTTQTKQPRWWDVVVSAIDDANGQPWRLLAVSRDVTELKQTEQALRIATEQTAAALCPGDGMHGCREDAGAHPRLLVTSTARRQRELSVVRHPVRKSGGWRGLCLS
jgi:PAS domain S-box-containing protein